MLPDLKEKYTEENKVLHNYATYPSILREFEVLELTTGQVYIQTITIDFFQDILITELLYADSRDCEEFLLIGREYSGDGYNAMESHPRDYSVPMYSKIKVG